MTATKLDEDQPIYDQPPEQIAVRTYTTSDDLPASELRDIEIDQEGFVWVATIGGLAKFDGHSFTPYTANPEDPTAIPRFVIDNLASDPVSGMWAAAGVLVFADYHDNEVTRTNITMERMDRANQLIWGWNDGVVKLFDPSTRQVVMERPVGIVPLDGYAVQIAAVSDELAVIGGQDGLWVVTADGKASSHPTEIPVRDVTVSRTGKVWVFDDQRLSLYDPSTDTLTVKAERIEAHPGEESAPITSGGIIERRDGSVWMATELGGVEVYEPSTDTLHLIEQSPYETGIAAKTGDFMEDRQGGLWMSAFGIGMQYLPAGLPPVWGISFPQDSAGTDVIDTYLDMERVDDTLWLASDGGGLHPYDLTTNTFGEPINAANSDLPADSVIGLARDGDELWIGMWDGGITRFNLTTHTFNPLQTGTTDGPVGRNVFDIVPGPDDTMWASVWGSGVQVFDLNGKSKKLYGPNGDVVIKNDRAIAIAPDQDGASWFAGWAGIERVDHRTGKVTNWSVETGDLLGDIVFDLHFAKDGVVWVGTSAGLERLDTRTGKTDYFGHAEGVPGPAVIQIVPIPGRSSVWLATAGRLAEFDLAAQRVVQTYGADDGLPAAGFGRYGNAQLPDGVTVISTEDGLAFARGEQVPPYDPPVFLTSMTVDELGTAMDEFEPIHDGNAEISVDAARLTMNFTGLDFRQPDGMQYEYRLLGLSDDWVTTNAQSAAFSRLTPGRYTFEVRARTASGTVSTHPATVRIWVVPHWWQTFAARAIGVALLALLVVLGTLWMLRRARRRNRELERLVMLRTVELEEQTAEAKAANAAKTVFVSNVSHELRNPLQSVLGFAELIVLSSTGEQQQRWAEQIHTSGSDLLSMIEELLELSALESSSPPLAVSTVDVRRLVEEIAEGIDSAPVSRQRIQADIHVERPVVWCDSRRLRQVLANLTLNAVRHSTGDKIVVSVREVTPHDGQQDAAGARSISRYRFSVRDGGPGMSPEEVALAFEPFVRGKRASGTGAGLGLAISRQLVARLGGVLAVDTAPGSPTDFYFELELRVGSVAGEQSLSIGSVSESFVLRSEPRFEQLKAILVDPDTAARQSVADELTLLGVTVRVESSGRSALDDLANGRSHADLVVLSDRLPDIDTAEFVHSLRMSSRGKQMAILLTSAQPESSQRGQSQPGDLIDGFLRKPIALSDLAAEIQRTTASERV